MAWGGRREWFEYWGLQASLMPLDLHPLLRWRMRSPEKQSWIPFPDGWLERVGHAFVDRVLRLVDKHGPVSAGEITPDDQRKPSGWFNWSDTKLALEWLFYTGQVTIASRRNFTRMYDLTERVLSAEVLALPTPTDDEAQRELVRVSARALGVATEGDLHKYWYLWPNDLRTRVGELVETGELLPATVEGWRQPAYLWHQARRPRQVSGRSLLSPFDTLLFGRSRGKRLFNFDHYIEFYRPREQRVYGYFVLPFLLGDRIVGRVDLKAERKSSTLLVRAAHAEPNVDRAEVVTELATELRLMADWLQLESIVVVGNGDLAGPLASLLP